MPTLRQQANIAELWEPLVTAREYDPRNVPITEKPGVILGKAKTEKQGGSDVRANATTAQPAGSAGPGPLYNITDHKYFVTAPMSDGILVLVQVPRGLSCFMLPRWAPEGTKNAMELQQLKRKMDYVSNACPDA